MSRPVAGDRFDQYELQELVARSGMAAIFKARDTLTGATVALKIPHLEFQGDAAFSERFQREEELGQRLDHPHVVRVLRPREKSRTYLAMEWVDGKPLRALLGERPMPVERALHICRQLCEALAYLAARGVVHRDLKPENVLVGEGDQVKLIDFGIAVSPQAEQPSAWGATAEALGTPDYMAPEQIRGDRGDARTDIYGLGMLLYELLTAHLPYGDPDAGAVMRAKTSEEPEPPRGWVPALDPRLEAIILRAIERDPRHRYASAADMLKDLQDPASVPPRDPAGSARNRRAGAARRRWLITSAVLLVAALLALAGIRGRAGCSARRPSAVERRR